MKEVSRIAELHWLMGIIQNVDVGLVVLDREHRITLWNGFMENHSGLNSFKVKGQNLFETFPEIPEAWLKSKIESVLLLDNRSFTTWRQRPYLIEFNSYHPITGRSEWMYQNVTILPLSSASGEVEYVCIIIYDVTETATDEIALQGANAELERLGSTDGLTGLLNRRAWEEQLNREYMRNARTGQNCVMVMFDIDHFKSVNDTYGHQAGDDVIRTVAKTVHKSKRETDIAGRYGGEEFCIILLDTNIEGGYNFAERLRTEVEQAGVAFGEQVIRFTISLGVAEIFQDTSGPIAWLERADKALYQSKESGRNRTSIYQAPD